MCLDTLSQNTFTGKLIKGQGHVGSLFDEETVNKKSKLKLDRNSVWIEILSGPKFRQDFLYAFYLNNVVCGIVSSNDSKGACIKGQGHF